MSATAKAVETVVRARHSGIQASGAAPEQARFRDRPVSVPREGQQRLFERQTQQAGRSTGAAAEGSRPYSRLVKAVQTIMGLPETNPDRPSLARPRFVHSIDATAREMRTRVLDRGRRPDGFRNPAATHARQPAPPSDPLPWLTSRENVARRSFCSRLAEMRTRPGTPAKALQGLAHLSHIVDRVEQDILRAHALLEKSQTELLSDAEWLALSNLITLHKSRRPAYRDEAKAKLASLAEYRVPGSNIDRLTSDLRGRLSIARAFLFSDDPPSNAAVRLVEVTLPVVPPKALVAECRIIPGTALGAHLPNGYPGGNERGGYLHCVERYRHVPGLAQMSATDGGDRTLFAGLRHGLIHAGELDGEFLARLAEDELKSMVGALLFGENGDETRGQDVAQSISEQCRRIKASPEEAVRQATAMRRVACRQMALETAAAALITNSRKFRRALAGETVNLRLCSIAMLEPGEIDAWCNQAQAFAELSKWTPTELRVLDPDGTPRTALADIKVRQFVLTPESEHSRFHGMIHMNAIRLLGSGVTRFLGGEVNRRFDAIDVDVSRLQRLNLALQRDLARCSAGAGRRHHEANAIRGRILKVNESRLLLKRKALSLVEAGQQLKTMWTRGRRRGWPRSEGAYRQVVPRLALVCHLMDEIPVLSCMTGNRRIDQLQPEVMFVATATDCMNGLVPRVDLDSKEWDRVRNGFADR